MKEERKKEPHSGGMEKCMSEVIVVTSGKGGVGKTTTSANVGTGLAKLNKKVVLIDTDIGLRNLDVVMGLEKITFGWYMRKITWVAFVGYLAGIVSYWLLRSFIF